MADDLGLFNAPKEGRYVARPPARPWTLQENFVLLPVLIPCQSERAYLAAVRFLCATLDREPVFGPNERPDGPRKQTERNSIIERRTVTELLSGLVQNQATFARDLWRVARIDAPLTWAERNKFLRPYAKKAENKQPAIPEAELLVLLDRAPNDARMGCFLGDLRAGAALVESQDETIPAPTTTEIATCVRRFVGTPADNWPALRMAWAQLWEATTRR